MLILCFEDRIVEKLAPITHARPAYAITCAGYRLIDWLDELRRQTPAATLAGEVREHLRAIQEADYALEPIPEALDIEGGGSPANCPDVLLVNARLVPSLANFKRLVELVRGERFAVVMSLGDEQETEPDDELDSPGQAGVIAAWMPAAEVAQAVETERRMIAEKASLPVQRPKSQRSESAPVGAPSLHAVLCRHAVSAERVASSASWNAFHWPHEVVAAHMTCINESIEHRIATGDYSQLQDGVFVGKNVSIGKYESIHTSGGAIVLDDDVQVGPFCFLEGPLYAGRKTRVIEHSSIKDGVSLGHTTKIGGEVEASVIEPYTNKQHHGFLGHSYLGSWINLGAGTCNSDLKNTYGKINIEYGDERIATGMQFLGCIMGDYSKSAINTGIFTGKVIGVCSMMYGFVTGNVPSYVNYARLFGQTSLLPPEVMVNTQARMFARRKVAQRQIDIDLIHAMYHRTEAERRLSDQLGF
ncbi:putative sugar nucleotidyl transferase [Neorhodopirellula pilleata]|uniref:Bifunctional protein GlmU n=1 Tax=Neorhodopirellula pilleata TaxID=2714738 RepID=A0A5C6ATQ8_9BACT|nr:putative sugar nucleotidyl transferase [Neorhodopirellula pilleata]TWU03120.1 Bifunctional protein GlmU [Neorhodopirellula pilleata]